MPTNAKDPGRRARLLTAAGISVVCSGFVGGLVFFGNGIPSDLTQVERQTVFAAWATMMMFWLFFLPLYLFKVHRSRARVEFEHQARLEERRRAERTRQALKSSVDAGDDRS